jgi:hypothetical protein
MADSNAAWTRREQIELDGIAYDLSIEKGDGEYIGKWRCQRCGQRGESTLKSATPEQALERAKVSVFAHHTLVHGDQAIES